MAKQGESAAEARTRALRERAAEMRAEQDSQRGTQGGGGGSQATATPPPVPVSAPEDSGAGSRFISTAFALQASNKKRRRQTERVTMKMDLDVIDLVNAAAVELERPKWDVVNEILARVLGADRVVDEHYGARPGQALPDAAEAAE